MNFTKSMGFSFSYLIYTKNIKQKLRRQLQGNKAIRSIYKAKDVKTMFN
jgi:hypothetical protein